MPEGETDEVDRVEFTCSDCGEEIDREQYPIDIEGLTPARCIECSLAVMAEGPSI